MHASDSIAPSLNQQPEAATSSPATQKSEIPLIPVPFLSTSSTCPFSTSSEKSIVPVYGHSIHPMQARSKSGIFKPKLFAVTGAEKPVFTATILQEPTSTTLAINSPHWKKAIEAEYQALVNNHTWDLVPNTDGLRVVQCKWVFRTKLKADGSLDKYKARLVAKGFQRTPGVDFSETFSPVVKASTIRVVFTLAVSRGWGIQQIDINNAFLNGDLQEEVFMVQPEGFINPMKPHHECKLR